MNRTARRILILAALLGALAVALGAFGAHGLKGALKDAPDAAQRLAWWDTAIRYQMWHALLLAVMGSIAHHQALPGLMRSAGLALAGVLIFSGTLCIMTLTGNPWLGRITPIGGLLLILAWLSLAWTVLKQPSEP